MAKFTDEKGRDWNVFITSQEVRDVRTDLGFDLLDYMNEDGESLKRLQRDAVLLVDILWVVLKKQIADGKIDERDFAERLFGNAIDLATDALIRALADFSSPRMGAILRQLWEKNNQAVNAVLSQAERRVTRMEVDPEAIVRALDQKMDEELAAAEERFGGSFLKQPPPLVSSLGNTPSEN